MTETNIPAIQTELLLFLAFRAVERGFRNRHQADSHQIDARAPAAMRSVIQFAHKQQRYFVLDTARRRYISLCVGCVATMIVPQ
jgi:hypothetical protein